jgi:shikimate dehydrogenase
MRQFGLIGYPLGHSFSKKYFTEKFEGEGILEAHYELFPLENIDLLPDLIHQQTSLHGLNVTIPYKESVIPFLDAIDPIAAKIGAVNCIHIQNDRLTGFNTDYIGFSSSLMANAAAFAYHPNVLALILGNGGASKAVRFALDQVKIDNLTVTRSPQGEGQIDYTALDELLKSRNEDPTSRQIIINCTPLGTFPSIEAMPPLNVELFTCNYFVFDLIYNPEETVLLRHARLRQAHTLNGLEMLIGQAEAAWSIWNKHR